MVCIFFVQMVLYDDIEKSLVLFVKRVDKIEQNYLIDHEYCC